MGIYFREAVKADFNRINELFMEMLRTIYERDDVKGYQDGDLDYYFSDRDDWICVADSGGKVEGFLSIEVHREPENYLYYDDCCVSKNHRCKGIGNALINEAEKYCKNLGFSTIVLHVEETNTNARRFYEKRGFSIQETDRKRLCMVKHLK